MTNDQLLHEVYEFGRLGDWRESAESARILRLRIEDGGTLPIILGAPAPLDTVARTKAIAYLRGWREAALLMVHPALVS